MKRYPGIIVISSVALAMLALSAPASAGQRERRSTQSQQQDRQGSSERRAAPQQRQAQPQVQPRQAQPQPRQVQPRQFDRQIQPRQSERQIAPDRRAGPQYQSRAIPRPQIYAPQRSYGSDRYNRYDNNRYDGRFGRSYGPTRFAILPRGHEYFTRYYSFRPRLSIGFGLYVGYPVPFPRWYDSYWYSNYGYNFSSAPYGGYSSVGGLSFDITQPDAELWIDGEYVGLADDFSSSQPPLTLSVGVHHVELGAPGYRPMEFDITVVPGQVIPYQGSLSR